MMNNREETKIVKKALIEAGFDKQSLSVTHDRGTAASWLGIYARQAEGQEWEGLYESIIRIAQKVTGRHGDYHGEICVTLKRAAMEVTA